MGCIGGLNSKESISVTLSKNNPASLDKRMSVVVLVGMSRQIRRCQRAAKDQKGKGRPPGRYTQTSVELFFSPTQIE